MTTSSGLLFTKMMPAVQSAGIMLRVVSFIHLLDVLLMVRLCFSSRRTIVDGGYSVILMAHLMVFVTVFVVVFAFLVVWHIPC